MVVTKSVVAVCRRGRLFGADPNGRLCTGRLKARMATARADLPYVRRGSAIPIERIDAADPVPICGEIDPFARSQSTTMFVGGQPTDTEITYLGSLPQ